LKYLHDNGCPWNEDCCEVAASNKWTFKRIEIIEISP